MKCEDFDKLVEKPRFDISLNVSSIKVTSSENTYVIIIEISYQSSFYTV